MRRCRSRPRASPRSRGRSHVVVASARASTPRLRRASRRIRSSTACRSRLSSSSASRMAPRLVRVVGEHELEREVRATQPPSGVDARSKPEADGTGVDGRRIDASATHERLQARHATSTRGPGARRRRARGSRRRAGRRRRSSRARRGRDCARTAGWSAPRRALPELVDDTRSAQLGKRVRRRSRRHDRAVGKHVAGSMVVGHDDVEATLPSPRPPPRRQ